MKKLLSIAICALFAVSCASLDAQSKRKSKKDVTLETSKPQDSKKQDGTIKAYDKVITKDAISDEGLFQVHRVGDKYYFEIPLDYLDTDMLLVSRFAKLPSNLGGG